VAFSLLASLVVAILIIPMLYSRIYRKKSPFTGRKRESVQFTGTTPDGRRVAYAAADR